MAQHNEQELRKLLAEIKIPPAPEILSDLNSAIQKPEPDLSEITDIIQKDAGISGMVLKTVNSPLFGLRNKVSSIRQAVTLLGISYTVNIVMGLVLRQTFDGKGENLPRYWESPSNIAMISASLAPQLINCSSDEAYLLGLFHNAGHALIQQRKSDYLKFYQQYINHPDYAITYFENQHYNFDHAVLGYYLSSSWAVPEHLQQIILNHHNVSEFLDAAAGDDQQSCEKGFMAVLKIAEHIELVNAGVDDDHEWQRVKQCVLEYLQLSEHDFDDICADTLERMAFELD